MAQVTAGEFDLRAVAPGATRKRNLAAPISTIVFSSLMCLLALVVVPYGASQVWWKALIVCIVFTLAIPWLIEGFISGDWFNDSWPLVIPILMLAIFSLLQTLPVFSNPGNVAGVIMPTRIPVSADPYQTRFFTLELLALTIAAVMLFRYASSERRMRITINVLIGVAVANAIFGIFRQTTGLQTLFGTPFVPTGWGYAQFINRNHFAFLMEMSLGLILGLLLGGGVKREQALIYLASLMAIWTALVLCDSRGGLVAMLVEVIFALLLFGTVTRVGSVEKYPSRLASVATSRPVRVVLIVTFIVGVIVGTTWIAGERLAMRLEQARSELTADADPLRYGASRQEIWKASWKLFTSHPVLGVGMGAYWTAVPSVHDASGSVTPREAHNDYLELLASGGLIGLALGVWFVIGVLKRTRENLRSPHRFRRAAAYGAATGIAGVAVHSFLDFGLHSMGNAFVFTTLIVIATSKPRWANERGRFYEQVSTSCPTS